MVDRGALFTGLLKRNALRLEAGLSPLNIRVELAHEVALAVENKFIDFPEEHTPQRLLIRDQVTIDLRARYGSEFGYTLAGRWAINHETNRRFSEYLSIEKSWRHEAVTVQYAIIYGTGSSSTLVEFDAEHNPL